MIETTKTNKTLIAVAFSLFLLILVILTFMLGLQIGENNAATPIITSRSIYEKITNSALLTSKIAYINQKSTIEVNNESTWSKLLWGQTLTAEGIIKVSVGIDLKDISENDITVNNTTREITIRLAEAKILNSELTGNIETTNQQGILKMLLENDPNADFNQALQQLQADASTVVSEDENIFADAFKQSSEIIKSFYEGTGYTVTVVKQ